MADIMPLAHEAQTPPEPVPFIDLVAQHESIAEEIGDAVTRVFAEQKFILGESVADLETAIAEYCDAREAIGCASGTDALILALMGLDIGPGDEVITSPFTFFATASSICRVGARPVFVDIDPQTYNIDPAAVAAAVTPRTRAIMPVHLFGQCADMDPLWRIAAQHDLAIVEDACQAIGASYQNRRAGVLGRVAAFSFFPTKNLGGAGDGGMITTDDHQLAARLRRLRVHGDAGGYRHLEIGLNSRLDALQAAVLQVKLNHLDNWSAARCENAEHYRRLFESRGLHQQFLLPDIQTGCQSVYNQFTIRIPDGRRDAVMEHLRSNGVGCAVYYPQPLHLQECFAWLGAREGQLPISEAASCEVLSLPIFPELKLAQLERVVDVLCSAAHAVGADHGQESIVPHPSLGTAGRRAA